MNSAIAIASLVVLVAVIAISAITKKNAGVIGLIAAYILALVASANGVDINVSKIVTSNWPTSVFFIVLATTFLFGIATINGTTQALSRNIVCLARGNAKLLPIIFFIFGAIISAYSVRSYPRRARADLSWRLSCLSRCSWPWKTAYRC